LTYNISHIFPVDGTGSFFYTYPSIFVMVSSVSIFVLFRSAYDKFIPHIKEGAKRKIEALVVSLSGVTFGVYLIHILILEAFETTLHLNPAILRQSLVLIILTVIGSFISVFLLTRIPFIRYVLK
jgi:surface polysaccharide O-acyltransferase-like enzyme